jgi:DNA-binding CsgD family transcriptional regulator
MNYSPRIGLSLDATMSEALANVVGAIGRRHFHEKVLDLLGTACVVDFCGAMVFFRDRQPRRLVHRINPAERTLPEESYLNGPYALDPHYQLFLRGAGSGIYWLRDVAPDDFFESEYYRLFYSQLGLSDSIDLMWRIDEDTALLYFVERSIRNPAFQHSDVSALNLMLPYVVAASVRHNELTTSAAPDEVDTVVHRKVRSTMDNFASSLLTQREREVLFYMLSGYSAALTAERLETTEGTIKVHRKNIHRKLDIGSQAELFSLFINCIAFASPDGTTDPLEIYQKAPVKPEDAIGWNI